MTSGPDVPRTLPYRLQRRNGLNILDRTLGDDDRTARAVRLMKPLLLTIVIVAVSFTIIAVAAGGAAASLTALTTLVCTGMGTSLYRRLALRNLPEPQKVPPRPRQVSYLELQLPEARRDATSCPYPIQLSRARACGPLTRRRARPPWTNLGHFSCGTRACFDVVPLRRTQAIRFAVRMADNLRERRIMLFPFGWSQVSPLVVVPRY